jgi:hypothetical protein
MSELNQTFKSSKKLSLQKDNFNVRVEKVVQNCLNLNTHSKAQNSKFKKFELWDAFKRLKVRI